MYASFSPTIHNLLPSGYTVGESSLKKEKPRENHFYVPVALLRRKWLKTIFSIDFVSTFERVIKLAGGIFLYKLPIKLLWYARLLFNSKWFACYHFDIGFPSTLR